MLLGKMATEASEIFLRAVQAVLPKQMISNAVKREGRILKIADGSYQLNRNVYVIGFGKAVLGMARTLNDLLSDHIVKGVLSVPIGIREELARAGKIDMLLPESSKITVYEGAKHNLPDAEAFNCTLKIMELVKEVRPRDLLFVLISGGGSALLTCPVPHIKLEDKLAVTKLLVKKGADIDALNTVRQNLSVVKGGGLARLTKAQTFGLILSDIVGDPIEKIASGPTVGKKSTKEDAMDIIRRYDLVEEIPASVRDYLQTPGEEDGFPNQVKNILIGTNTIAIEKACQYANSIGYQSFVLNPSLVGESREVGRDFARLANALVRGTEVPNLAPSEKLAKLIALAITGKNICVVCGGETTVKVTGNGWGGRNQEMALSFGLEIEKILPEGHQVTFLSAGTDGIDSNTPAAGAVSYPGQMRMARQSGLEPETYLSQNDSHNFYRLFNSGRDLVITGHTGTNVMDIQILLIKYQ